MDTSQYQILKYCLNNCIFDGWTTELLENACKKAGLDKNYWQIYFPNGAVDVADYFIAETNRQTEEYLKGSNERTTAKIRSAIKYRLELNNKYKQQIRTMLAIYALHPIHATKANFSTADSIWRAAGDKATDWNFYTKRGLLAAVYNSTLLYWLEDKSEDNQATWEFLDRRLEEVGKFNKGISKLKEKLNSFKLQSN